MRPTIRRATPEDAAALALAGAATFLETYALSLPGRDLVRHCGINHAATVYEKWLNDPACAVWVVEAGEGRNVVGFGVLTSPDLPCAEEGDLELRRIYILSKFQGNGLGRELVDLAAKEAQKRGAKRLLLGVYGENEAALGFYTHIGLSRIGHRQFQVGDKTCFDYVLGKNL
ncbi:GNAT family N-acetyltransferase [bacterium]|nr:MAG: GNAT family N-acetyltransferase [bacterium]